MNVVTYARVSTVKQETEGQSLVNQERAFEAWLARETATRIARYAESKSAKSIEGRAQFLRMIAELPILKPDLVIVDTIDRFSRNLKDGLDLLDRFRGHGIALLPLDWDDPINLDSDRDWKSVVQELTAADYERRRIRSRIVKSFNARRARGATTHSFGPFGLVKRGDALVPVPELIPVLRHAERLFLSGKSLRIVLEYVQRKAGRTAWKSQAGLHNFLVSAEYSKAGIRSKRTQELIDQRLAIFREQAIKRTLFDHPMAGVVLCGLCLTLGFDPKRSKLGGCANTGRMYTQGDAALDLVCQGKPGRPHKRNIHVQEFVIEAIVVEILRSVSMGELSPHFESLERESLANSLEQSLYRRLAELEESQRQACRQMGQLVRDLDDNGDTRVARVKEMLTALNRRSESDLLTQANVIEDLTNELASTSDRISESSLRLAKAVGEWPTLSHRQKNDLVRAFCEHVSSNPILYRNRGRSPNEAIVTWDEIAPGLAWRIQYGKFYPRTVEILGEQNRSRVMARLRKDLLRAP